MKLFGKILGFNKRQTSANSIIYRDVDKKRNINNTHRQKRTNMLANIFNIYGGSRLPENPNELIKQGWNDITHEKKKLNHAGGTYSNPYTKQVVDFDKGNIGEKGFRSRNHYHWHNPCMTKKKIDDRLDKYGRPCGKGSEASHILPKKGGK